MCSCSHAFGATPGRRPSLAACGGIEAFWLRTLAFMRLVKRWGRCPSLGKSKQSAHSVRRPSGVDAALALCIGRRASDASAAQDGCNPHIVIREETPDAEIRVATSLALQVSRMSFGGLVL